jgi:hypothetical protein
VSTGTVEHPASAVRQVAVRVLQNLVVDFTLTLHLVIDRLVCHPNLRQPSFNPLTYIIRKLLVRR